MDETEIGDELAAFARLGLSSHWQLSRPSAVEAFLSTPNFRELRLGGPIERSLPFARTQR